MIYLSNGKCLDCSYTTEGKVLFLNFKLIVLIFLHFTLIKSK